MTKETSNLGLMEFSQDKDAGTIWNLNHHSDLTGKLCNPFIQIRHKERYSMCANCLSFTIRMRQNGK